jgi:outer membrane beta-barrel protein
MSRILPSRFTRRASCARLAVALAGALGAATSALAMDLDPKEIRGKSSKEPVTVLQNRYFTKTWRPEVGFLVGQLLNEAYLNTQVAGVRAALFVNEWLGFEVQQMRTAVHDSDDRKALNKLKYKPLTKSGDAVPAGQDGTTETTVSPDPEVNAVHQITDFSAIAAPFYGKLNFLNKWIIYTDLYVSGGLARVETDQGTKSALALGLGERLYIGEAWSLRLDFKDRNYAEERAESSTRKNSYSVDLGASYFFN